MYHTNIINNQDIIFLSIAENVIHIFEDEEQKKMVQNVVLDCWNWIKTKEKDGNYFYELLDDEEKGLVTFQENTNDEKEICAWNCIIDAVAYISRKAYELKGQRFFPQAIEIVDNALIEHTIENFLQCNKHGKSFIDNIVKICSNTTDIMMIRQKILKL